MSKNSDETLNPSFILSVLGVKDTSDTRMVLVAAFKFLLHMKPGELLKIENIKFRKVSNDIIVIENKIDCSDLIDTLEEKKVIRITS